MENRDWLLASAEPWTVYRTWIDLVGLDESDERVVKAKQELLAHPLVVELLKELEAWPGTVISSHKSAGQHFHKLSFVADLGLKKDDGNLGETLKKAMENLSEESLPRLPMNIPTHFGGTGVDEWAWALCDAPLTMHSVAKMGMKDNEAIRKGMAFLFGIVRENGWPCTVSKELGKFRGPGKKDDPCPIVNLIMLKLISNFEELRDGREAHIGVECLLNAWEKSLEIHPYMFYMGTDFRKLKAPFIWYDILHVADVLSLYDFARKDGRLIEMVELINSKVDSQGLFTPESEWKAWKNWDFGQKKKPSSWLTFLVYRINKRLLGN